MRGLLWLIRRFNYILVFIILEIFAFVLISNHQIYQHSVLLNLNREIAGGIYSRIERIRSYINLKEENESLLDENALLKNKLDRLLTGLDDTTHIKYEGNTYYQTTAHIVHGSFNKQFNYLTIDAGKLKGVSSDMAVMSSTGIVGVILESSANFSTILPVINRDFRLTVKIKNSNFSGILQWEGNSHRLAELKEIPYHAELQIGDTIETSGYSALFPEGLFVGTIDDFSLIEGNFYNIDVRLGTDYQRLYNVYVINNLRQEEQLELQTDLN
ncbi:rod shape-determining protein MreC [Bacteroidota bacterium]